MVITSAAITEADRLEQVRDQAGISERYSDAELVKRIEQYDPVARSLFHADGVELVGDEPYFRNLVMVSNLLTASGIRLSIGGAENVSVAQEQSLLLKRIVSAYNKKEPEQGAMHSSKTEGVGRNVQRGTFN